MTAISQLRLLTLNRGENGEAKLYRLEKGIFLFILISLVFDYYVLIAD